MPPTIRHWILVLVPVTALIGVIGALSVRPDRGSGPSACTVEARASLPGALEESSGLARGVRDSAVLWSHNDGAEGRLYALDGAGRVQGSMPVEGVRIEDWEAVASDHCDGTPCLLLGDIGDNDADRTAIAIHEVTEPEQDGTARLLRSVQLRYPDAAQDAEALFALPGGQRFIITKGRHGPVTLYRVPQAVANEGVLTLERVRELAPRPGNERDRVTAASATADGRWVALRTYRRLLVFAADVLLAGGKPVLEFDLGDLREPQGEGLAIDARGRVWLSSEAERSTASPTWTLLTCPLPAVS
jgi:hypothetical protein